MKRTYYKLLRADEGKLLSWSCGTYNGARELIYRPNVPTTPLPLDGPLAAFTTLADAFAAHAEFSMCDLHYLALITRCTIVPSKETKVWVAGRYTWDQFPVGTQLAKEITIHSAVPPAGKAFAQLEDRYRDYYRASYHLLRDWPELAALFPCAKSVAKASGKEAHQ